MEDLLIGNMSSVIFGNNIAEPVWYLFLHLVEIHSRNYLFLFTFLLGNLSNFVFKLLLIDQHVSALAPVIGTRLCKNLCLIISHVSASVTMLLYISGQAETDSLIVELFPIGGQIFPFSILCHGIWLTITTLHVDQRPIVACGTRSSMNADSH